MTREVHQIPPAPRHTVRWTIALWYRWPLAVGAFVFGLYGGLWSLMLFYASAGKPIDDAKLDTQGVQIEGRVLSVKPVQAELRDAPADRVDYEFQPPSEPFRRLGFCFVTRGLSSGDPVRVEFLEDATHVNRIVGGRISLLGDWVTPALWISLLPGGACLIIWLLGVLRTRDLLVHGDVARAQIVSQQPVPWVVPEMLSVGFAFRDRHAVERTARQWVRARSRLGQRIAGSARAGLAVIHDRERPDRHRLVIADEF